MSRPQILAVCTVLLAMTPRASAQVVVGAQASISLSSLNGDGPPDVSYSSEPGVAAGFVGEIPITSDVRLSLQPMYLQRGFTIAFRVEGEDEPRDSIDVALDYVALPVLVKIVSNKERAYVSGGLNLSYLFAATEKGGNPQSDIKEVFRGLDLSADFAFGVQLPIGAPLLTLELRYEQGITNAADPQDDSESESLPVRFRTSGFQFLAGFLLPLGKE